MTTDPSSPAAGRRLRFSMGQLMALVGAAAAVAALYSETARQAAFNGRQGVDPIVLSASIVVAAVAVAALRRSSATGMLLALGLSASALALYGSLRQTPFGPVGPPAFAMLTVAVPLWVRRELGGEPASRLGRRLAMAARVGLDSSLNLLGLVVLLMVSEAVGNVLPSSPTLTISVGPAVYPSSSSVVLTGALTPIPMDPRLLPELAPPPPEINIELDSSGSEFPMVDCSEGSLQPSIP